MINMKGYILDAIADFSDDITKGSATPATNILFEINSDSPTLDQKQAELFHSIVAKLLYVAKKRPPLFFFA
jgi:hypothetical protein